MAVKTQALIEGVVTRVNTRSGTTAAGKDWERTNILVVGDNTLADVTVAQGLALPPKGTAVKGVIEVGVYRDDDSVEVIEWLKVGDK